MDLGKLESVNVREVWSNEATDFTPWLAQENNLSSLADALGLEFELEAVEKDVGSFRADIICKELSTGTGDHIVLIENQLTKTDHSHLGQILTYMAGIHARTAIWIAEKFTEEHRAAVDMLNDSTREDFNFFAVEIQVWKIGTSQLAPSFNIVAKPNQWSKTVASAASGNNELTETKRLQLEYWTVFRNFVESSKATFKPTKPLPQHWMNISIGRSNFGLVVTVNTMQNSIAAYLTCVGPDSKAHFALLLQNKEVIEEEFGEDLIWEELPGRIESRISLRRSNSDPSNKTDWDNQHIWLAEKIEKLRKVFAIRIKNLNADDLDVSMVPEEED